MDWRRPAAPTDEERALVARYMDASDRADVQGLAALLHDEVRFAMPPTPGTWVGRDRVVGSWIEGGFGGPDFRDFRTVATSVNLQPAVACYLKPPGDETYRAMAIDVLGSRDGLVDDITTFDAKVFPGLGLAEVFDSADGRDVH
jgi:RNA polymerase sigma-70 factor (ECF subfamily)